LPRLTAHLGLMLACLALGDAGPRRQKASDRLIAELEAQILPDGGHISRSPTVQQALVCDLAVVRDAFVQSNTPMPERLGAVTARAIGLLQLLHLGEGVIAFAGEGDPAAVRAILEAARQPTPILSAPRSGFERVEGGSTLLIVDTGEPPADQAAGGDGSRLAFELASGTQRICHQPGLMLGDLAHLSSGEVHIEAHRRDEPGDGKGGSLLELSHDFYRQAYGRRLARTLYVQARGGDVRGEDRIEPTDEAPEPEVTFRLRFQIDAGIVVELDGASALLALPDGEVWRFQCRDHAVRLADAIQHGPAGAQAAHQLVIEGCTGPEPAILRWAFKREAGERASS